MNLRIGAVCAGFPLRVIGGLALGVIVSVVATACGGGSGPEQGSSSTVPAVSTRDQGSTATVPAEGGSESAEITGLVEAWYAHADPAVCEEMTGKLLEYGWGETGAKGVKACRTSIEASDPVANTKVDVPKVSGERATVVVAYTLDKKSQRDKIRLVLRDGAWKLDGVSRIS